MIGITLIEDLAVVILTVLLPSAGVLSGERLAALALDIGKSLALLIPIMFVTAMVAPRLMAWVARMGSEELYLLIALALGLAVAAMTQAVGLSLALGAFLAGVVISGSEEGHKTLNKLLSLRDAFVALFFVTIGALVNPRALISNPSLLVVILGMIVVGKLAIWTTVVWVFRYPFRTAVLVGLGLTQIGEFSYVLAQVARKSSLIGEDVYNATLAASLISILLNAALMRFGSKWIVRE
jgi:monovalent cation:H+ antiporter-2, CPA2 family